MTARRRVRHYAFLVWREVGGWRVYSVAEYRSRGEADEAAHALARRYDGAADAITLDDRELRPGDFLPAHALDRPAPAPARMASTAPRPAQSRT